MPPTVNEEIKQLFLAKNRGGKVGLKAVKGVLSAAQKQVKAEIGLAAIDSWDAYHLPQLLGEIERHLATFGTDLQVAVGSAMDDTWNLGTESVDKMLAAAGETNIGNFHIPKSSLEALKNFTANTLKGVTADARAKISAEVSLGILTGKKPSDVSSAIGNALANGADKNDRSVWAKIHRRANMITNTEMGRVLSVAANERLEEAGLHVPDLKKRWIHAGHPASPRQSHVKAEFNEPVPVKEPFIVGGTPMMFPRDPGAPLEHVIHCGCIHVAFKDSWKHAGEKKLGEQKAVVPGKKKTPTITTRPKAPPKLTKGERTVLKNEKDINAQALKYSKLKPSQLSGPKQEIFTERELFLQENLINKGWRISSTLDEGSLLKSLSDEIHGTRIVFDGRYLDSNKKLLKGFADKISDIKRFGKYSDDELIGFFKKNEALHKGTFIQKHGNKKIKLYRGVKNSFFEKQGIPIPKLKTVTKIETDSMTSWTTNKKAARMFSEGGTVLETETSFVDVLLSHTTKGSGLDNPLLKGENEVVLKGALRKVLSL